MKKAVKWIAAVVVLAGIVLQFFFRADLTNPPVEPGSDLMATNAPPAEIADLLRRSCYDCHSYETTWPWYSHVTPIGSFVAGHVNDGRDAMNFSEWPHDDPSAARKRLAKISHHLQDSSMPLPSYTLIHWGARLSAEQRKQLEDWAAKTAEKLQH